MKLTNTQRRKLIAQVFERALPALADEHGEVRSTYICIAIETLNDNQPPYMLIAPEVLDMASRVVQARIFPHPSFNRWLETTHPHLADEIRADQASGERKMQQTRKGWLKSLIEEFSQ